MEMDQGSYMRDRIVKAGSSKDGMITLKLDSMLYESKQKFYANILPFLIISLLVTIIARDIILIYAYSLAYVCFC